MLPPRSVPIPITDAAAVIREDSPPTQEKRKFALSMVFRVKDKAHKVRGKIAEYQFITLTNDC